MSLDIFKEHDENSYIVWADCRTQLRCEDFNYFFLDELASIGKEVDMNWFFKKHGKIMRDQHFCSTVYSDLSTLLPVNCRVGVTPNQKISRIINAKNNKIEETNNDQRRAVIYENITKEKERTDKVIEKSILNFCLK